MSLLDYVPMIASAMGGAAGAYLAIRIDLAIIKTRLDHMEAGTSLFRSEMREDIRSIRGKLGPAVPHRAAR